LLRDLLFTWERAKVLPIFLDTRIRIEYVKFKGSVAKGKEIRALLTFYKNLACFFCF
jgi:hypothetical protein